MKKEHNRNWTYLTSDLPKVGDLVWWNFGSSYRKEFTLCIITDTKLDKADQRTRADWWAQSYQQGHSGRYDVLQTEFVENTARDNCRFNSFTLNCPQNGRKLVVLLHPTYKEKNWVTNDLGDYFLTQATKEKQTAQKNHNILVMEKTSEAKAWWRTQHADFFTELDRQADEANEGQKRKRTYHAYDLAIGAWINHIDETFKQDQEVYETFMKEAFKQEHPSAIAALKALQNLIPERLQVGSFTNGVEEKDGTIQGRIDVKWKWSVVKTMQWFEKELGKDFGECELQLRDWVNANCPPAVAEEILADAELRNFAFTKQWFNHNVLDWNERKHLKEQPDKPITISHQKTLVWASENCYETSNWSYELD